MCMSCLGERISLPVVELIIFYSLSFDFHFSKKKKNNFSSMYGPYEQIYINKQKPRQIIRGPACVSVQERTVSIYWPVFGFRCRKYQYGDYSDDKIVFELNDDDNNDTIFDKPHICSRPCTLSSIVRSKLLCQYELIICFSMCSIALTNNRSIKYNGSFVA